MSRRIEQNPDQKTDTGGRRHKRGAAQVIPVRDGKPCRSIPAAWKSGSGFGSSALAVWPSSSSAHSSNAAVSDCQSHHLLSGDFHRGAIETRTGVSSASRVNLQANRARRDPQANGRRAPGETAAKRASSSAKKAGSSGKTACTSMRVKFGKARLPPADGLQKGGGQSVKTLPEMAVASLTS